MCRCSSACASRARWMPRTSSCSTTAPTAARAGYEVLTPLDARRRGRAARRSRLGAVHRQSRAQLPGRSVRRPPRRVTLTGRIAATCRAPGSPAAGRPPTPSRPVAEGHELPEHRASSARALGAPLEPRASCCSTPQRTLRLRARLAAPRHLAAAALLLRHPVVELRDAGAHRVGAHEHAQASPGVNTPGCNDHPRAANCAPATCAPWRRSRRCSCCRSASRSSPTTAAPGARRAASTTACCITPRGRCRCSARFAGIGRWSTSATARAATEPAARRST